MKLQIEYLPTNSLKAYEANARVHSDAQLAQLEASIAQFGFNVPVLVRSDLTLVAGHGRVEAAKRLGLAEVPVIRIEHLSEEQVRAFTLADNKIALNAGWDFEKLSTELSELVDAGFDLGVVGFDESELDSLLAESFSLLPDAGFEREAVPPVAVTRPQSAEAAPVQWSQPGMVSQDPQDQPEDQEATQAPQASADRYSNFEMLMLHANKVELVEKLSNVRQVMGYPKLEDALMHVVRSFEME